MSSCLFLFIARLCPTAQKYHNLFNYSSVNGQLGCFQFGIITNKAVINVDIFSLLLGKYFVAEWLGHRIDVCLAL